MMTARAEYRLSLRHDNADLRLSKIGYDIGLLSDEKYQRVVWKSRTIESELERLRAWSITPTSEVLQTLSDMSESPIYSAVSLADLLKRPSLSYQDMARFGFDVKDLPPDVISEIEVQLKYDAY